MLRSAKRLKAAYIKSLSDARLANYFNRKYLSGSDTSLIFSPGVGFKLIEKEGELIVPRRSRLHYYRQGLKKRLDFLRREYLGNIEIEFESGDIIVDCGSNIGEFIRSLTIDNSHKIFAFEPDPEEYKALKQNIGTYASVENLALWDEDGEIEIFLANDTGDSGVFNVSECQNSTKVRACRLDSFLDNAAPHGIIRLLKIEAEGAEPEVLSGARGVLERTKFLAIDVGPERGPEKLSTLVSIMEILNDYSFKMINFNPQRVTCLFENRKSTRNN